LRSLTPVPLAYVDSAFRIPVDLSIGNLTPENHFLHLSVRAVRRDLIDSGPVVLRVQRTVFTFSESVRESHFVDDRFKAILTFTNAFDTDFSDEHTIFSSYLHTGVDRFACNLSFLVDRDDISRLDFISSYVDPTAFENRRAVQCSLAWGIAVALFVFWVSSEAPDPKTVFIVVVVRSAGIAGVYRPDGSRLFEICFDALFVSVYRMAVFIEAYCLAINRYEVRICAFVGVGIWCGCLAIADITARSVESAARLEQHVRPTATKGDVTDVWNLVSLIVHAVVVFVPLFLVLLSMGERFWARAALLIMLLIAPMIVDVMWDLQFPLFGILPYSSIAEVSRSACYTLGTAASGETGCAAFVAFGAFQSHFPS
jgi:hypothetical protein